MDISCRGVTRFSENDLPLLRQFSFSRLEQLAAEGLVLWSEPGAEFTPLGHQFIRNVCSSFDLYLQRQESVSERPQFSQAI